MTKTSNYIILALVLSSLQLLADSWTQKADLPGGVRSQSVSFSIGNKGYIGTGIAGRPTHEGQVKYQDFWEWDPVTNVWTQKADFAGGIRYGAVGFSIGAKGYVGTGIGQEGASNDFWEYDPSTNTWTQKANFGGAARYLASGFSIGTKGYIGVGLIDYMTLVQDFWEWDQATDTWTQKADFSGVARGLAVAFSIGAKGYIGTGSEQNGNTFKDFWEWDQATDTWIQKADFGGTAREEATGFSIGDKGYMGMGAGSEGGWYNDFWEYCETCSVTAIDETNYASGISLYPNPSTGFVFLDSDNSSTAGIKVFNSAGEMVYHSNSTISSIDLSGQPKGVYIVLLTGKEQAFSKTIIIQ
jgi:N-acetylneuraminic acid mutarotase